MINNINPTSIARHLALGAGLVLGLAACSQGAPEVNAAGAPVATVENANNIAQVGSQQGDRTPERPATETDQASTNGAPDTTVPRATAVRISQCDVYDFPVSDLVTATSDLNIRSGPGTSNPAISHIKANQTVEFAYWADNGGCAVVSGGAWWAIWDETTQQIGWSHSSYLFAEGYVQDFHGDEGQFDEDFTGDDDVHIDCVFLQDGSCIEVSRTSIGSIGFVFSPVSGDQIAWAQLGCVYGGDAHACDLLFNLGWEHNNYGLGNSLTQIDTDSLINTCSHDGWESNPYLSLECAELDTRN